MEKQFHVTTDGQEVNGDDLDLLGETAALADDRILSDLLRVQVTTDGSDIFKGVLPYGSGALPRRGLVARSGAADARVRIYPLRCFVGTRTLSPRLEHWRDIRSAIHVGTTQLYSELQLPAVTSNPRWDLIYAKVDIDINDPGVVRYVKTSNEEGTAQTIVVTKSTVVTIVREEGEESATPSRPSLPADSGSSYYIPLAYVLLSGSHTLTTTILANQIDEVGPVVGVHEAAGGTMLAPPNQLYSPTGTIETAKPWTPAAGRPDAYLPPSMSGGVGRFFGLNFDAGGTKRSIPLDATTMIDNSIDWRNRMFRWFAKSFGGVDLPWTHSDPPGYSTQVAYGLSQGFYDDSSGSGAMVMQLNPTVLADIASGASVQILVNLSNGNLYAKVGATNPSAMLFLWIDATAPFQNA